LHLGPPVALVAEDAHGIEIEAPVRLAPGRTVDVVSDRDEAVVRMAVVWTWNLIRLGREGPRYRGICRWV
jgi:hypothetical protein